MNRTVSLDLPGIHDAYYAKVVACATKFLGRAEADDVAQEVLIKIDRSMGTLSEPSKLSAWIYTITLNTIRDFARKQRTMPVHLGVTGRTVEARAETREVADVRARMPDEALERREMIACYLEYVSELPPTAYEVYVLSEFEGLSDDEIARRLSVSRGAVKIRLHRARTRLFATLRQNCRCYRNRRGELMGGRKQH